MDYESPKFYYLFQPKKVEVIMSKKIELHKTAELVISNIFADHLAYTNESFYGYERGAWREMTNDCLTRKIFNWLKDCGDIYSLQEIKSIIDFMRLLTDKLFTLKRYKTVNCLNGRLRFNKKWELLDHRPSELRLDQIPVNYNESATAPVFSRFIDDLFNGDADKVQKTKLLLEIFGLSLISSRPVDYFLVFYGTGANGKSVVIEALKNLIGGFNCSSIALDRLRHNTMPMCLYGKLANIVTEISSDTIIDDGILKTVVSGEAITVDRKFREAVTFSPYAIHIAATNQPLKFKDSSHGLLRRLLIIPFNNRFEGDKIDREISQKISKELPGILNMALSALADVFKSGTLTIPKSSDQIKLDWLHLNNPVADFIAEKCTLKNDAITPSAALYQAFVTYCRVNGQTLMPRNIFSQRLSTLGQGISASRNSKSRKFKGVALRESLKT